MIFNVNITDAEGAVCSQRMAMAVGMCASGIVDDVQDLVWTDLSDAITVGTMAGGVGSYSADIEGTGTTLGGWETDLGGLCVTNAYDVTLSISAVLVTHKVPNIAGAYLVTGSINIYVDGVLVDGLGFNTPGAGGSVTKIVTLSPGPHSLKFTTMMSVFNFGVGFVVHGHLTGVMSVLPLTHP
jgi:hypothetical protein